MTDFIELLAILIGSYSILTAVLMLTQPNMAETVFDGFEDNPALSFSVGVMMFFAGGVMVGHYHDWSGWVIGAISTTGWVATVKGAILITAPSFLSALFRPLVKSRLFTKTCAVAGFLFGLSLILPMTITL